MESGRLDNLIGSLDELVEETKSDKSDECAFRGWQWFVNSYRHDWRPVWELCTTIQTAFSEGVFYPNVSLRQQAWLRFIELRNEASRVANSEREEFQNASLYWRKRFIANADWLDYSRAQEAFFTGLMFPATTVEEMKGKSAQLKELVAEIHENRKHLTRAHFDECLTKTREIRDRHNTFWDKYREHIAERREQFVERQKERIRRIEANIGSNQEKLERCQDALDRNEAHINDLNEKISEARSDTWRERFETWLSEAEAKRDSMLETRARLGEWIEQGQSELRELYRRIE